MWFSLFLYILTANIYRNTRQSCKVLFMQKVWNATYVAIIFNYSQFLQQKEMSKKIFYRNGSTKAHPLLHGPRANKLSMDDITSWISRAPSELKKRNSNDHYEYSKVERLTDKKMKMCSTLSKGNSMLISNTQSPMKFSLRNSQVIIEQRNKLKAYKFYYQIGFGGFGRVWKVCHKESLREWAMKQISKKKVIQKNNIECVLNESKILSQLSHPFLINMRCAFQDAQNLYLVMDYLRGGDLRYHICYKNSFSEKQIRFLAVNIIIGLEYVHANKIIHKDLKPQNIVFEQSGYVRITDFGIARNEATQTPPNNGNQSSGTPVYMAPQILFKKDYSYESDFYALGVIIYELTMGKRPFEGKNRTEIRDQLLKKDIHLTADDLPYGWSPHLADLINQLLKKNPTERLGYRGASEIKSHRYFGEVKWRRVQRKEVKPPYIPNVISEMKEYLDQIALFNQMNQQNSQENAICIDRETNQRFREYDYERAEPRKQKNHHKLLKTNLKKNKRMSQRKIIA